MKNLLKLFTVVFLFVAVASCSEVATNEESLILSKKNSVVVVASELHKSMGTGFFIDDNIIVTNYHVVKTPDAPLKITMENGDESFDAEFIMGDALSDIAFIKIRDFDRFKKEHPESSSLMVRTVPVRALEDVYVIGHPWGLFYSISKGVVSYHARKPPTDNPMWFIQTDAHVFQGNSGGPMIDKNGKLVGINVIMISNNGGSYGLAIPSPILRKVKNDLEKYNEVRWARLGIQLGKDMKIMNVEPDTAAAEAGLVADDTILGIYHDTQFHKFRSIVELLTFLSTIDYQDKVYVLISREGVELKLPIQPRYKVSAEFKPVVSAPEESKTPDAGPKSPMPQSPKGLMKPDK